MTRLCRESSRSYPGRSASHAERAVGAGLRTIPKGVESPPAPKAPISAFRTETPGGRKQKSAEAIVAIRPNPGRAVKGRTPRNKEEPCATHRQ